MVEYDTDQPRWLLYMNHDTVRRLNSLNAAFYDQVADSFAQARRRSWPSWDVFFSKTNLDHYQPWQVADIGCGTARLAGFLQTVQPEFTYRGLDISAKMLAIAKKQFTAGEYQQVDVVEKLLKNQPILDKQFDLIAVFGVMHHIPGSQYRRQFLQGLASRLKRDGEIWLSFWQPPVPKQLDQKKTLQQLSLSSDDLEPGDVFLGWQSSLATRFVHSFNKNEVQGLVESVPEITTFYQWRANQPGERDNICLILHKKPGLYNEAGFLVQT